MTRPELLAPAGDSASIHAALAAGADAIYMGIGPFNMRRAVDGKITLEQLPELAATIHAHGVKLYLTVNTIIYEGEAADVECFLDAIQPHVDAVICSDWLVIQACHARKIPVHISTQMSCSNSATARFLQSQGATRVVLARECTLEEIATIHTATDIEIEVFVHGAQCVAISGRCFLSQLAYGCSANRGACLQACRRQYHIREVQEGEGAQAEFIVGPHYLLSAKDVCGLPFLPQLVAAGVSSFKIEGRARNPEYVATVVRAYRRALDAIASDTYTPELQAELLREVEKVYHRPFGTGLLLGRPGDHQFADTDDNQATEKKLYVGIVRNYYQKPHVADVLLHDHSIKPGDTLAIHGATTGVSIGTLGELQQDGTRLPEATRGQWCTFQWPDRLRVNDKVYKVVSATPQTSDLP